MKQINLFYLVLAVGIIGGGYMYVQSPSFISSAVSSVMSFLSPSSFQEMGKESYIGKIYQPLAGPLQASNKRPHYILYEDEPYLKWASS